MLQRNSYVARQQKLSDAAAKGIEALDALFATGKWTSGGWHITQTLIDATTDPAVKQRLQSLKEKRKENKKKQKAGEQYGARTPNTTYTLAA